LLSVALDRFVRLPKHSLSYSKNPSSERQSFQCGTEGQGGKIAQSHQR